MHFVRQPPGKLNSQILFITAVDEWASIKAHSFCCKSVTSPPLLAIRHPTPTVLLSPFFQVPNAYIPTSNDREVNAFKKLNREKSFDEARTAVQSQIERIFQKAAAAKNRESEANGNSLGSSGGDGGLVGGGGGVEVVSPLPVAGITLKVRQ